MKLETLVILILTVALLGVTSGSIYIYSQKDAPSEVVTKVVEVTCPAQIVYQDRIIETEVVREVPVEITVPNFKIVEIPKLYRDWMSVEQFKDWYLSKGFTTLLPNGGDIETADCDDYANWVARTALEDGYLVSEALIGSDGLLYGVDIGKSQHMGCLIEVGNGLYYVEPYVKEFRVMYITEIDSVASYEWRQNTDSVIGTFTIGGE